MEKLSYKPNGRDYGSIQNDSTNIFEIQSDDHDNNKLNYSHEMAFKDDSKKHST